MKVTWVCAARCAFSNAKKGKTPVTVVDLCEGKSLKVPEPHGRYWVRTPERSVEEQAAEAVENGASGTTAGWWQDRCWWTLLTSYVEGGKIP